MERQPGRQVEAVYHTTAWQRVERRLARILSRKVVRMHNRTGIVSFSFDDVPASACHTGASILERHGARGTFYVSGALTGAPASDGEMHTCEDLKRLHAAGHEIGSHGFAHLNYQKLSAGQVRDDIAANRSFLAQHGFDEAGGATFAFPFGCANLSAKKLVIQEFACARSTDGGVNLRTMDVALLRAISLYDASTTREHVSASLEKAAAGSGWLIFYTHEVCENPGRWGCTSGLLEFAVSQARQLGLSVVPVKEGLRRASSPEQP